MVDGYAMKVDIKGEEMQNHAAGARDPVEVGVDLDEPGARDRVAKERGGAAKITVGKVFLEGKGGT